MWKKTPDPIDRRMNDSPSSSQSLSARHQFTSSATTCPTASMTPRAAPTTAILGSRRSARTFAPGCEDRAGRHPRESSLMARCRGADSVSCSCRARCSPRAAHTSHEGHRTRPRRRLSHRRLRCPDDHLDLAKCLLERAREGHVEHFRAPECGDRHRYSARCTHRGEDRSTLRSRARPWSRKDHRLGATPTQTCTRCSSVAIRRNECPIRNPYVYSVVTGDLGVKVLSPY